MRRLTLLLCLLMVAALQWIIGSAEVTAPLEPREVVLPKTHITLKAVNTGFKATPVVAGVAHQDAAWIANELPSAAIDARPPSTTSILSRSNRRVEFEFIVRFRQACVRLPDFSRQ